MTNLINRILAKFNLKLEYINQKPDTSLVEATIRFMDTIPKHTLSDMGLLSTYVGDINYIQKHVNVEFPKRFHFIVQRVEISYFWNGFDVEKQNVVEVDFFYHFFMAHG